MVASGSVFSWKRPDNLGVRDGRLAPCKRSPNCVSSQADPSDREHYIAPIRGSIAAARDAIKSLPRTTISVMLNCRLLLELVPLNAAFSDAVSVNR